MKKKIVFFFIVYIHNCFHHKNIEDLNSHPTTLMNNESLTLLHDIFFVLHKKQYVECHNLLQLFAFLNSVNKNDSKKNIYI